MSGSHNYTNKDTSDLKNRLEGYSLGTDLKDNIELIKNKILNDDSTIVYRWIANIDTQRKFCLVFVDGMINNKVINENIIDKIMNYKVPEGCREIISYIKEQVIIVDDVKESDNLDEIISAMLYGDTVLFLSGSSKAFIINTKGWQTRSISEPQSETIIVGPREGFNESINVNISLIRRKINSPDLKFNTMEIGTRTRTKVAIVYVDGIVKPEILADLKKRISNIDIEGIFSSNTIKELIQDHRLAVFNTVGNTERPDIVASKLLQGRIAIICDGSPSVLTLPYLFVEPFQVNEDYYENYLYSTFNRLLRLLSFLITVFLPGIFIATVAFHKEILPTRLALSIFVSRENVPLTISLELLGMLILFEILREAGLRLPKHIGATVSIVGALILGDAAVSARFIASSTVIIVSLTGICGLLLYEIRTPILILRFMILALASYLGLYGVVFSAMGIGIYLVSMRSFGIPYMLGVVDINFSNFKDILIRAPWDMLKYRNKFVAKDPIRANSKMDKEGE